MGAIGAATAESGRAFAAVFRNPGLRRINLAFAASVIGDWAYAIAVSVWAFQEGGATALGLFGVSRYVVMAVLGPVLSTLADRYPKKLVMIGADLAPGGGGRRGRRGHRHRRAEHPRVRPGPGRRRRSRSPSVPHRLPCFLVWRPIRSSSLRANVVASTIESVGFFAGPALAGLLLAIADVEVVYLVNAATFVVSAALIAGLTVPASARGRRPPTSPRTSEAPSEPRSALVAGGLRRHRASAPSSA